MKCRTCGSGMVKIETDLPFKIGNSSIVIVKDLPVLQCSRCGEYVIDDIVMKRVDEMLAHVDRTAELEIISFAA
ncbi:MAG: type II toxin-antitoxin system MqsA family antitoxin [Deltaproteobacteria bacterium]|nr:type II toxin-antitoxin system MqsA family antitoxin [Deltaproteobacteria bacterium]MBI5810346.1 type II toxin-antitoxin system MqsA family antitoxin [Deltaproteobacteria bacterium]